MTTEDIVCHIFLVVDDHLPNLQKHPQAKLYSSELVTISILFALKGMSFRAFHRWLKRDHDALFAGIPERSRLQRFLKTHKDWCNSLLAEPSFFTVIDTYPIELIFPVRQGRSKQQVGRKGRDKGRWSVGIKLCWLLNETGEVVAWDWAGMNVYEEHFNSLLKPFTGRAITLADLGFRDVNGVPDNLKLCPKGTWNEDPSCCHNQPQSAPKEDVLLPLGFAESAYSCHILRHVSGRCSGQPGSVP